MSLLSTADTLSTVTGNVSSLNYNGVLYMHSFSLYRLLYFPHLLASFGGLKQRRQKHALSVENRWFRHLVSTHHFLALVDLALPNVVLCGVGQHSAHYPQALLWHWLRGSASSWSRKLGGTSRLHFKMSTKTCSLLYSHGVLHLLEWASQAKGPFKFER